jgi:hypothetical protein
MIFVLCSKQAFRRIDCLLCHGVTDAQRRHLPSTVSEFGQQLCSMLAKSPWLQANTQVLVIHGEREQRRLRGLPGPHATFFEWAGNFRTHRKAAPCQGSIGVNFCSFSELE